MPLAMLSGMYQRKITSCKQNGTVDITSEPTTKAARVSGPNFYLIIRMMDIGHLRTENIL